MRTKTLLIALGALALGAFSSRADVTSANIVGYANVITPGSGGTYYMMTCPFVIGVSNGADEVYGLNANPNALPPGSTLLKFNVGATNIQEFNPGGNIGAGPRSEER